MHSLFFKGLERFVIADFGDQLWTKVGADINLGQNRVDTYDATDLADTGLVVAAMAQALHRSTGVFLERFGNYLVTAPEMNAIRRLLRFSGTDFVDFIAALPDLKGRAKLAVPDLDLPPIGVREVSENKFEVVCQTDWGFAYLIRGMLVALAKDYGALVEVGAVEMVGDISKIVLDIIDQHHANGNEFTLVEVA